jgi:hypothetical protein
LEMTEKKPRALKTVRLVVLGVLLCAIVGAACFFWGRYTPAAAEKTEISAVVLENRLADISELASVTYNYTNMGQFENSSEFYGITLPFTTKKFILTYDGTVKAGVDLHYAAVTVESDSVTVDLPEPKVLSHEIDERSIQVFDEKTSIFNPFTVEDFAAFQADQKDVMERKAIENGLLEEARTQAEESIRLLLESVLPEDYTLTVK